MPYHHVLIKLRDDPKKTRCIFADLTAQELKGKFLKPHLQGRSMLAQK